MLTMLKCRAFKIDEKRSNATMKVKVSSPENNWRIACPNGVTGPRKECGGKHDQQAEGLS